jgi:hypothetical protein
MISAACIAPDARATQPRQAVQFDVTAIVAFADSTTAEFADAHPGEKTVRGQFVVSLFVPPSAQVSHALYHFYFPEGPARVIDYAPRTRVTTDVIGEIEVAENAEQGKHVSVSGGASVESWISADAATGRNQSSGKTTRYKLQPQVETVLAAGTSHREQGVYFKLQRAATETLEGEQRFELELRVPETWRGGYVRMLAQASGLDHISQASSFLVPVYLQGDSDARQVATQLLAFERRFLRIAAQHAGDVRRAGRPTVVHEMALRAPEIPADWQAQLLWRSSGEQPPAFFERLPQPVRVAAANFHAAKRLSLALGEPPRGVVSPDETVTLGKEFDAVQAVSRWRPRFPTRSTPEVGTNSAK